MKAGQKLMSNQNRTMYGGRVDRSKTINFVFNGKKYKGFQGDTLASALLANDVHLIGRSFKYHRARGILTAGSEEPNAKHVGMKEIERQVELWHDEKTQEQIKAFNRSHPVTLESDET